jgi:CII-binding regulator of phage lambda lysogenization HflD
MNARIQGLREMISICEKECREYMDDKGEYLAESARQLDKERKEMLENIAKKEAELIAPLRSRLKKKCLELKSLKSKILMKKNMNLAQDVEVTRKTKSAIERIQILKEDNKELDREYRKMELELHEIEPKMAVKKQMAKSARKKMKALKNEEKQKALNIVKESVRIYGAKNLNKILKGELSK